MTAIVPIDPSRLRLDIHRDWSVHPREEQPGPPQRIDGMTVGIITMREDAPHGGEVHPDGDEILYVFTGKLRVSGDSGEVLELGPGAACIVRKGEWHRVQVLEETQLLYITPGPNGEHRPKDGQGTTPADHSG